jgi:sensor c-di-GMP phosphodiesterase-like protein
MTRSAAAPLFAEPLYIDGQELRPTIRSGLAFFPDDARTADALVQNAEAALNAAREDNEKSMMYGLVTQRPTSRSLALEARLTRALDREEFLLHYQPKVDIKSGKIQGLEALLRWQDSEEAIIQPSVFIPLLE